MYVTYDDVVIRYPSLKTTAGSKVAVNSDLIYYAAIELNEKLASGFSVPFSDAHPTVKDLAIDMCFIRAMRSKDPKKIGDFSSSFQDRINALLKGEAKIYTGSGTTIATAGSAQDIWSSTEDYHPVHSMLDADNPYTNISSEQLQDEESERGG